MDVVWDLLAAFWWVLWRILLMSAAAGVVVGICTYFRIRRGGDDEAADDEATDQEGVEGDRRS